MPSRFWKASGNALLPSRNTFTTTATTSTFDPATKDAHWNLSSGNTTASLTAGSTGYEYAFGQVAKNAGSFDMTVLALGDEVFLIIGISSARTKTAALGDSGQLDKGYYCQNGDLIANGNGHGGPYVALGAGDKLRVGWSAPGSGIIQFSTNVAGAGWVLKESQDVQSAYGWSSGYPAVCSSSITSTSPSVLLDTTNWG